MAFTFNVNGSAPATFAACIFALKEQLKTAGWTVTSSSDGTTFNGSGDQISSSGTGAGGMDRGNAWFAIQMPGGTRAFAIQLTQVGSGVNGHWRVRYSPSVGFSGGSASVMASASDQVTLLNSAGWTNSSDGSVRVEIGCDNASPYGFYMFLENNGAGTVREDGCLIFEPLVGTVTGDVDPYVVILNKAGSAGFDVGTSGIVDFDEGEPVEKWALLGSSFTNVSGLSIASFDGLNWHYVSPQHTPAGSLNVMLPVTFALRSAVGGTTGWKGVSTNLVWNGPGNSGFSTFSVSTTRDYIALSTSLAVPWNGSTPSV